MVNRLFTILYILLRNKKTTANYLANYFEVSTRTIYRDIEKLSYAGFPIYTNQGVNGGIFIDDEFTFDKSILTKTEQDLIITGLNSLKTNNKYQESIINNLIQYFNGSNKQWLILDEASWSTNDNNSKVALLKEAILSEQIISFKYFNNKGEASHRKVYPLNILNRSNAWYLEGYCTVKNSYRIFKLNRINELIKEDDTFDYSYYMKNKPLDSYNDNIKFIEIELLFDETIAYRVLDEFIISNITFTSEKLLVKAKLPDNDWLRNYILGFGSHVKILSPSSLKDEIVEISKNILAKYDR